MFLARVLKPITAVHKDTSLQGRKLLLVQYTDLKGKVLEGSSFIAVEADNIGAGVGDWVLVQREGSGCREMMDDPQAPINAMVCGIVDHIH